MIETIRQVVRQELARLVLGDVGAVTAVDWKQQRARVKLASSGQETGWLAIGTGFASQGDGTLAPIRAGDQVAVMFFEGRPGGQGIVLRRVYGSNAVPDLPEQCVGVKRGSRQVVLLGADGKTAFKVQEFKVEAVGEASVDGSQVKLGGGTSAAVKYEELEGAVTPWTTIVSAALTALGITVSPPVLSGARAAKVKVG